MPIADGWFGVPLAVACAVAGLYFVRQLAGRRDRVLSSAAHAVMAVGMAVMFAPAVDPLAPAVWAGAFLLIGAWFAGEAIRQGSLAGEAGHHVVGAVAMLFMLAAHGAHVHAPAAAGPGVVDPEHAHHAAAAAGSDAGLLASAVALALAAWFLTDIVRRSGTAGARAARVPASGAAVASPPRVRSGALLPHVVMSGAMAVMLVGMA